MVRFLENYHHFTRREAEALAYRVRIQTKHLRELYWRHSLAATIELGRVGGACIDAFDMGQGTYQRDPTLTGRGCFERFSQIMKRFHRKVREAALAPEPEPEPEPPSSGPRPVVQMELSFD